MKMEKRKAIRLVAYLRDFDGGDGNKWRNSFYELWRYQMTLGSAYSIVVNENRNDGVFVSVLVKLGYKKNVLETMQSLGYRNIEVSEETVGVINMWDADVDSISEEW